MRRMLIGFGLVLIVAVGVCSAEINTNGLTEEQKAQLIIQAEQMKKQQMPTVEKVNQWVDLGKNVGLALVSTAKELGVAADAFLQSTTGKITVALIFWKIMGRDVLHMFVGVGLMCILIPLWIYFFRKMCIIKSVKIEYLTDKPFKKIKHIEHYGEGDIDGTRVVMLIVLAATVLVGLATTF